MPAFADSSIVYKELFHTWQTNGTLQRVKILKCEKRLTREPWDRRSSKKGTLFTSIANIDDSLSLRHRHYDRAPTEL